MADNIAEPQVEDVSSDHHTTSRQNIDDDDLTLVLAVKKITEYYSRSSKGIKFITAHQITDGSTATFSCEQTGAILASCKLRFRNVLLIESGNNELLMKVKLSDLTFKPCQIMMQ